MVSSDHAPERQHTEHGGDEREDGHELDLAPAAELKVMVQRRHLENALAVRRLKVGDLNDVRERLADVDDANEQQHERHIVGERQSRP